MQKLYNFKLISQGTIIMKSFMEFLQLKEEDSTSAMHGGKTANEVIEDLLHFKVGDKLLFNGKPIQIEGIIVDTTDSNKKEFKKDLILSKKLLILLIAILT